MVNRDALYQVVFKRHKGYDLAMAIEVRNDRLAYISPGNRSHFLRGKLKTVDHTEPAVRRQLDALLRWRTPVDKLPYVTNHVMLIVGTSDNVVGVESSKAIASDIPGAWLVQFKNATHLLMNELPVEFSRVVLMFLDETCELKY